LKYDRELAKIPLIEMLRTTTTFIKNKTLRIPFVSFDGAEDVARMTVFPVIQCRIEMPYSCSQALAGSRTMYDCDLAYIHHVGFSELARGAAAYIGGQLKQAGFGDGLVVDLGCGSGVLAAELLRFGYRVLGVDRSEAMIALARQAAPGAEFAVSAISGFRIPRCVAVCAIGEALSYLSDGKPVDLKPLFQQVFASLLPSGAFFFDVIVQGGPAMTYTSEKSGAGWHVRAEISEDRNAANITRRITATRQVAGIERQSVEVHRVQTFSRAELRRTLAEAGFAAKLNAGYGSVAVGPRRVVVTAVRPAA
jgi:SAM-dependent methyltransferase